MSSTARQPSHGTIDQQPAPVSRRLQNGQSKDSPSSSSSSTAYGDHSQQQQKRRQSASTTYGTGHAGVENGYERSDAERAPRPAQREPMHYDDGEGFDDEGEGAIMNEQTDDNYSSSAIPYKSGQIASATASGKRQPLPSATRREAVTNAAGRSDDDEYDARVDEGAVAPLPGAVAYEVDASQQQQQQQQHGQDALTVARPTRQTKVESDKTGLFYYASPIDDMGDDGNPKLFRWWDQHIERLFFSDIVKKPGRGNVVYIKPYKGCMEPPCIQLVDISVDRPLRAPFGLKGAFTHEGRLAGDNNRPVLDLSFDTSNDLLDFINHIDTYIKNVAKARAQEWFEDVAPEARILRVISYRPLATPSKLSKKDISKGLKESPYGPTLRIHLNLYGEENDTMVYVKEEDASGRECLRVVSNREHIYKLMGANVNVVPVVAMVKIWFMNKGEWGVSLVARDIIIFPQKVNTRRPFVGADLPIINEYAHSLGNGNATSPGPSSLASSSSVRAISYDVDGRDPTGAHDFDDYSSYSAFDEQQQQQQQQQQKQPPPPPYKRDRSQDNGYEGDQQQHRRKKAHVLDAGYDEYDDDRSSNERTPASLYATNARPL